MKYFFRFAVGLILLLAFRSAEAQSAYRLSAKECADYASKNNVSVLNALLDVKMQEQVNREITAAAYPHINASITTSYNAAIATQVIPDFISPATYGVLVAQGVRDSMGNIIQAPNAYGNLPAQFGTKWSATAGLTLSQIVFDGQVFIGLKARSAAMDFASKNAELTDETVRANVYKIYYQLVVGGKQTELLDSNISRISKLLNDAKIMYDNGFAEQLEVDKASVQLANLQSERSRLLSILSNGFIGLKVLIGIPVAAELILTDTLDDSMITKELVESGTFSYASRKDYQYMEIAKRLNEYNIRRYELSQVPTVGLSANYAKNAQRNEFDFLGKGEWFDISAINLDISIPIFNGFVTRSKIQQAKIDLQKTENQLEGMQISIDGEIASARNVFLAAIENVEFQKRNMTLAEKSYNQTKKKYEAGTGSNLEINAAQTDLKSAQTNYITSLSEAVIARIDYLKATGKLQ